MTRQAAVIMPPLVSPHCLIPVAPCSPSTARHSRISPVLIIVILVEYLNLMQSSNPQEVAWFVLQQAWQLNH
jgi:hypothetical protein